MVAIARHTHLADRRTPRPRVHSSREELLLEGDLLQKVWTLRRMIEAIGGTDALEAVLTRMLKTKSNKDFLDTLAKDNGR